MEVKDKLKQLRTQRGISQQTLADQIYVSRSAVAKWENGLGCPSQDSVDALAAFFEVDSTFFQTEEPEAVIVKKNRSIYLLRYCLIGMIAASLILLAIVGFRWFSTVSQSSISGLEKQAAKYFGYEQLQIVKTSQRGDFLAALCVTTDKSLCMCVFDRDSVFKDRWYANGGKPAFSAGEIASWNYGSPQQGAVLIFCGSGLPDAVEWYTFSNGGIEYTCPVDDGTVLDIFIILDSGDIHGYPVPLDENKIPIA